MIFVMICDKKGLKQGFLNHRHFFLMGSLSSISKSILANVPVHLSYS